MPAVIKGAYPHFMGQKKRGNKKPTKAPQLEASLTSGISVFGKKIIAGGIGVVIFGFWVLSFADSLGRNWASALSPFLILSGYAVIALGIIWPSRQSSSLLSR